MTSRTLRIAYLTNSPPGSGMGKPARAVLEQLRSMNDLIVDFYDIDAEAHVVRRNEKIIARLPRWSAHEPKPLFWMRALRTIPKSGYDVWHATNQTLSGIATRRTLLTVYDLIEIHDPQETFGRPAARWLYRGIPRAGLLTTVSAYTKRDVVRTYRIPEERVTVVPLAAGPQYRPIARFRSTIGFHDLMRRFSLDPKKRFVLYVGSEHPRKNVPTIVHAVAKARKEVPHIHFIKVGPAGSREGREKFLAALETSHMLDATTRIEQGTEETLPSLYNLADVFLFPTLYEGFGIPPLEAMQCGCPVIVSNKTSLPEVVGNAGVICDPYDVDALAREIVRIVRTPTVAADLGRRGQEQATRYSWHKSAEQFHTLYQQLAHDQVPVPVTSRYAQT